MHSFTFALALVLAFAGVYADYDYGEALWKSLLFYQAQRSGKLSGMNSLVSWRKDSALNDKGENGEDLTGGYYDAADYVKFGFPMAFTITVLSWGIIDYQDGYNNIGWLEEARAAVRWGTDYFLKAHVDTNVLYGQVGNGEEDHSYWGRPEDMTESRPAYKIDQNNPGTDLAAETAAALAAASVVFRDAGDASYADNLLEHAKNLYNFADTYRGKYSDSITDAASFYNSNDYNDELVWGAIWMFRASDDQNYLNLAQNYYNDFGMKDRNEFGWNDKSLGATAMLMKVTNDDAYKTVLENFCNYLVNDHPKTPKGLAFFTEWGSISSSLNEAYICLQASDAGINTDVFRNFVKTQLDYALGSTGRSFVVGFGNNPPTHEHHRAASCPDAPATCDVNTLNGDQENYHVLYGALVGGPDANDVYNDVRTDFVHNEVACNYNAVYQGILAAFKKMGY